MNTRKGPTVFVSWAQRDPGWDDDQAAAWKYQLWEFVSALRRNGIDAALDLHHQSDRGVDWTRWGPRAVREMDWILVALSPAWKDRWEGRNEPTVGAGAVAEADALKSFFSDNQDEFRKKLVLVALPLMRDRGSLVPTGLHGVQRGELRPGRTHRPAAVANRAA